MGSGGQFDIETTFYIFLHISGKVALKSLKTMQLHHLKTCISAVFSIIEFDETF